MTNYRNWKTGSSMQKYDLETLKSYKKGGIDLLELSISWRDYGNIDWAEFRKNADLAGIEIWSYHLPFANEINVANLDENERKNAVQIHKELIKNAAAIGIKHFVVHPSAEPIDDKDRKKSLEQSKKSLAEEAEYAAQFGAVICVEDLPRTCLGHNAEEMLELISADDRLRVCFDVNHLLPAFGTDQKGFVEALGDKIVTTHMSDYDFIDERHLFPGEGSINWNELVTALEQADYDGPFLYESAYPDGDRSYAHGRHMEIKDYHGKH